MDLDPKTDLSFTRHLHVPRAVVWECWTRPEHIMQFFVPHLHKVTTCQIDLRVGGRFDTVMQVDGKEVPSRGVYLEVIEAERLVFTDAYSEGWKPAPDPFMTALILLEAGAEGGTTYTAIARHRSPEARKSREEMGFFEGWGTVASQREAYAATLR